MLAWLHHPGLQNYNLPDLTISGDALISLGMTALMVTGLCAAVVLLTLRRALP